MDLSFSFMQMNMIQKDIHVMSADGFAKIELGTLRVVKESMPPAALKRALKITEEHNIEFERKWNEFFNR